MNWEFKRTEYAGIPAGPHRVRIADAQMKVSKSGNDMMELVLEVSGCKNKIWYYIVFLPEYPEITNRNLTSFFDSFGVEEGNYNVSTYIGKVGAAEVKHDEDDRAVIRYFIKKGSKREMELPPWKNPEGSTTPTRTPVGGGFEVVDDGKDDLPF